MAKFKCIVSGNIVEVHNEYDISQFKLQTSDYIEVIEEEKQKQENPVKVKKSKSKDK